MVSNLSKLNYTKNILCIEIVSGRNLLENIISVRSIASLMYFLITLFHWIKPKVT